MISSISNHIPSGDVMAQAVSEHQNHDRQQDIKAHSQGAFDALRDAYVLQVWSDVIREHMKMGMADMLMKTDYQQPMKADSKKEEGDVSTADIVPA
jgi:polyhydroxyalkanoate synthesis regulator protein